MSFSISYNFVINWVSFECILERMIDVKSDPHIKEAIKGDIKGLLYPHDENDEKDLFPILNDRKNILVYNMLYLFKFKIT